MSNEDVIYQRIGEFTVSLLWLENKLREIGWFILGPNACNGPRCYVFCRVLRCFNLPILGPESQVGGAAIHLRP